MRADIVTQDNVEFVVNAPYSEIVQRLSTASIGVNTMQDEHFGINVVEFMASLHPSSRRIPSADRYQAAGLIPIVHASAGPKLDIVVPYQGQRTGKYDSSRSAEDIVLSYL